MLKCVSECDGRRDCKDGSDEHSLCGKKRSMFPCSLNVVSGLVCVVFVFWTLCCFFFLHNVQWLFLVLTLDYCFLTLHFMIIAYSNLWRFFLVVDDLLSLAKWTPRGKVQKLDLAGFLPRNLVESGDLFFLKTVRYHTVLRNSKSYLHLCLKPLKFTTLDRSLLLARYKVHRNHAISRGFGDEPLKTLDYSVTCAKNVPSAGHRYQGMHRLH